MNLFKKTARVNIISFKPEEEHYWFNQLKQAGVPVTFIRLEEKGIKGNGHMVMYEKNNLEIAALLLDWAKKNIK